MGSEFTTSSELMTNPWLNTKPAATAKNYIALYIALDTTANTCPR
jgi:hypothetical protein